MARRSSDDLSDLLNRIGRTKTNLTIDDVADVVAGAMKDQKRDLIQHVARMLELARIKSSANKLDDRTHNIHARVTAVESELRRLQKGLR